MSQANLKENAKQLRYLRLYLRDMIYKEISIQLKEQGKNRTRVRHVTRI
jgi:hypothetical protein